MARRRFGIRVTVTQVPRDDGTVHYRVDYVAIPLGARVAAWTMAFIGLARRLARLGYRDYTHVTDLFQMVRPGQD